MLAWVDVDDRRPAYERDDGDEAVRYCMRICDRLLYVSRHGDFPISYSISYCMVAALYAI